MARRMTCLWISWTGGRRARARRKRSQRMSSQSKVARLRSSISAWGLRSQSSMDLGDERTHSRVWRRWTGCAGWSCGHGPPAADLRHYGISDARLADEFVGAEDEA